MSSSKIEIKVNQQQGIPSNSLNILPCRVHHTGTVSEVSRHFTPELYKTYRAREVDQQFIKLSEAEQKTTSQEGTEEQADQTKVVHFRGRKLKGIDVDIGNDFVGKFLKYQLVHIPQKRKKKTRFEKGTNVLPFFFLGCVIQEGSTRIVTDAAASADDDDEGTEDNTVSIKSWHAVSTFDKVTLWEHEAVPAADNVFTTGLTDFVKLSNLVRALFSVFLAWRSYILMICLETRIYSNSLF